MDHNVRRIATPQDAARAASHRHPRVFISYTRESARRNATILALADRLCLDGIDCVLDQYIESPDQGWIKWMADELERADFVLVICSETYVARCSGVTREAKGTGVAFESLLLLEDLADAHPEKANVIPVLLRRADARRVVPRPLRSFPRYVVDGDEGYEELYRRLTGQPLVVKPEVGPRKELPTGVNLTQSVQPVLKSVAPLADVRQCIELRIEREFASFGDDEREALLRAVGELMGIQGDVRVVKIIKGSVIVVLELARSDALVIYEAHAKGLLDPFGVAEVVPSFRETRTLELEGQASHKAELPKGGSRQMRARPQGAGRLTRVLVVDDEPSICKALTMMLGRAGYDAMSAQSGEAALAIVREEHIDVMVVDLRIPDMRGDVIFELASAYQPQLRSATIFMTGDITQRAHRLIASCKCPLLRKPFDLRDLSEAIAQVARAVSGSDSGLIA